MIKKVLIFANCIYAFTYLVRAESTAKQVHYMGQGAASLRALLAMPSQVVNQQEACDVAVYSEKTFSKKKASDFIAEQRKLNQNCRIVYVDSERSETIAEFCQLNQIEWLPLLSEQGIGSQVAQYLAQSMAPDYSFETELKKFKFTFWTVKNKQGYQHYTVNYHRSRLDAGVATDDLEHIITPHVARADRAWVMKTTYSEALSPLELEFLKRGFHIVCVDESKHFGNQTAMKRYQRFLDFLSSVGLAEKGIWTGSGLETFSVLSWASEHPETVASIHLKQPVMDLGMWLKSQPTRVKDQFLFAHEKEQKQLSEMTDSLIKMASAVAESGVPISLVEQSPESDVRYRFVRALKEKKSLVSIRGEKASVSDAYAVADHLMKHNGLLNQEELYLRRGLDAPLYPHLSDSEIAKNYQGVFKFPQAQKFDPSSDYFEKKFPAIKKLWYQTRKIKEAKPQLIWKIDARHPKDNPKGFLVYSQLIDSLAELSRAHLTLAKNQQEADEIKLLLEDISKVLVPQIEKLRRRGVRLPRVYPKYLRKFSKYAAGAPVGLRRAIGEQAWADIYSGRLATAYNNMDGIRFDAPLVELMNIFPTEKERVAAIKVLGRHINSIFLNELLVTSEGAVIHHNIFHYAYASYSLSSGYRFLTILHSVGYRFSEPVYEKMKKAAMLAADQAGHYRGVPPANYGGRAGGQSGVGNFTSWLESAAQLGDGKNPNQPDARILSYLQKYSPESKFLQKYKKGHPEQAIASAKDRVHTINRGAQTIQQYGDVQASAGGSSYPFQAHSELYMLARRSNYFQGLFMKQGSLMLRKKHVESGEAGEFHPLFNGYASAFIPGTTTDGRSNLRCLSIKTFLNSGTGGIGGGTSFTDSNTAIWGGNQTRWPTVRSRKSMFFFGDRITCLTSNIIPSAGSVPASIWDTKPSDPTITTLYQWQHGADQPLLQVDGQKPHQFPYQLSKSSSDGNVVIDRYGNSYVIHPDSNLKVRLLGRTQSQIIFEKKRLKNPVSEKYPDPLANRAYTFTTLDKKELLSKYHPVKGDFDLAYLEHSKADGTADAKCAYTVIVRGGKERADQLNASLKTDAAPYSILQQNRAAHVLYDKPSKTIGYCLFEPYASTPESGVIESCSSPAFLMWRDDSASEKSLSFVNASPYDHKTSFLTLKGKWNYQGKKTLANGTQIHSRFTKSGNTILSIHTPLKKGESRYADNVDIAPIKLQLSKAK